MIARPEASVIGMPIPGIPVTDAVTTEQDWVVTGSRKGQDFKLYVSPDATRDAAMVCAIRAMNAIPSDIDWITAARRNQVEQCVRMDSDWLRSIAR